MNVIGPATKRLIADGINTIVYMVVASVSVLVSHWLEALLVGLGVSGFPIDALHFLGNALTLMDVAGTIFLVGCAWVNAMRAALPKKRKGR